MKIALLSTSRADQSALEVAAKALREAGHESSLVKWDISQSEPLLAEHLPDLAVLHGDRWDCLIAATACTIARVPIAHIGGGDVTTGSYDERFRNAITMLADWHFVGREWARLRLSQLDVASSRIFVIGELAIDWLLTADPPITIKHKMGLGPYILVNWQPETGAKDMNLGLERIIEALPLLKGPYPIAKHYDVVFMNQNGDAGAMEAEKMIETVVDSKTGYRVWFCRDGLSREDYAALMKHCCCMVGNSSSGLIEAPVFGRPFVLVGDRQRGRPIPSNTVCAPCLMMPQDLAKIIDVHAEMGMLAYNGPRATDNPYGDGTAGKNLVEAMKKVEEENDR